MESRNRICLLAADSIANNVMRFIDRSSYLIARPNTTPSQFYSYYCKFKPDICIIHSSFLNGYYQMLDMIINSPNIIIIYISNKLDYGNIYKLNNRINFYFLDDDRITSIPDIIELMLKDNEIYHVINQKLDRANERLLEDRLVRKAKVCLIKKGYSEEKAHSIIVKKAMDERISKGEAAKKIIEAEEIERSFVNYDSKDKTNC